MAENLLDSRRLFNECDDAHRSRASGVHQRIDFVHLLGEAAHARFAADEMTSLNSSIGDEPSGAFEPAGIPTGRLRLLDRSEPEHSARVTARREP